jgi:hypothetical protein
MWPSVFLLVVLPFPLLILLHTVFDQLNGTVGCAQAFDVALQRGIFEAETLGEQRFGQHLGELHLLVAEVAFGLVMFHLLFAFDVAGKEGIRLLKLFKYSKLISRIRIV